MKGEIKIVVTGPMGAGKTTAINALAGDGAVSTDQGASDEVGETKETTTVAMDYAEIGLDGDERLRIYGTPGQRRFRYMWEILADGALGFIILVDATRQDPAGDMEIYLDNFAPFLEKSGAVIGITKQSADDDAASALAERLARRGASWPVLPIDPRRQSDVVVALDALMAVLEFNDAGGARLREAP